MSVLYYFQLPVSQPILGSIIPSIVLGLLLVFRTNTAYERFWEGRRLWGNLVNDARNMAWQIRAMMNDIEPEDRTQRIALLRLVAALLVACKLYLRSEPINSELEELISRSQYLHLKKINNPPLQIVFWMADYIQQQYQRGNSVLHYSHVVFLQTTVKYDRVCRTLRTHFKNAPPPSLFHSSQATVINLLRVIAFSAS